MRFGKGLTGLALGALVFAASASVMAQKVTKKTEGKGGSPHETVEYTIDGAKLTLVYGRPFVKGRELGAVAPDGKAYRMGADEATLLTTDKSLMFGSTMVPAGTYSLYAMPSAGAYKLIVNKQTGQWGTDYDEKQDLVRVDMKVEKAAKPSEQFTINFEDTKDGGLLTAQWGATKLSAPFMVH
jgi:Protein of unknown function (DUF2911)